MKINSRLPLLLFILPLVASIWLLSSEQIKHVFGLHHVWETVLEDHGDIISIGAAKVSRERLGSNTQVRDVRISLPMASVRRGCESVYGAVVARIEATNEIVSRYLLRFKYNFRKSTCESKDLSFGLDTFPDRLELQLIETDATGDVLSERSRNTLLVVEKKPANFAAPFQLTRIPFSGGKEFIETKNTFKAKKFSWNPKPEDVQLLIRPQDDLQQWIITELHKRIERCKTEHRCEPIYGAVARIDDPYVIRAFEEVEAAGIPLHIITNPESSLFPDRESWGHRMMPPWNWLRGNPLSVKTAQYLPMHTRFLIFGDDMVLSSNSNISFNNHYASRELATVYHGEEPIKIFKEIFAIIQSGLFYPIHVDLNDKAIILLNADRQRGYAASRFKPYLQIETNEGVRSSAYGIMYELMSRNPQFLRLAMSPLTSSCATYRETTCLKDILQRYQSRDALRLVMNGYFYFGDKALAVQKQDSKLVYFYKDWTNVLQRMPKFLQKFGLDMRGVSFKIMLDRLVSSHHERSGVLNHETVISGSANFAQPSTLNTIELLRDKNIACVAEAELKSAQEPYFLVTKNISSRPYSTIGDCEFFYERDTQPFLAAQNFKVADIAKAYKEKYGGDATPIQIAVPKDLAQVFSSLQGLKESGFLIKDIGESVSSDSSYLCIKADGEFKPLRMPPNECSK